MTRALRRLGLGRLAVLGFAAVVLAFVLACPSNVPSEVFGPLVFGDEAPTLTITEPAQSFSISQGESFVIRWQDTDPDSAAKIAFDLVDTATQFEIRLVEGLEENDRVGPNSYTVSTAAIPPSTYNIRGTISDGINAAVSGLASQAGVGDAPVVMTLTEAGLAPSNTPPQVEVLTPVFNLSVAQDDPLAIQIAPTAVLLDPPEPYDPDSDTTVYFLLDLDDDPTNDNFEEPDPNELILLSTSSLLEGETAEVLLTLAIDLTTVPLRPNGEPYFIRVTIDDGVNSPVHAYAAGTINVVRQASGVVDLGKIGKTLAGVRFLGFNPGSNLGTRMISVRDFDADGVEDMLLAAQYGNPSGYGNVGEAYLIYGLDGIRYGGDINVNSVSSTVPGAILTAPAPELAGFGVEGQPATRGITDLGVIGDLDGDGRPELLVGMAHIDGIHQGRDDDPGDAPPDTEQDEEVVVSIRNGSAEVRVDGDLTSGRNYTDFEDTYIDSASPNENFGSSLTLEWDNDGVDGQKWVLMKFAKVLDIVPDVGATIDEVEATVTVRVVNTGDEAAVHELFTDFAESGVTYANFAENNGDPEPDVDYDAEALETVSGDAAESVSFDISGVVRKLLDGELAGVDDEIRLIFVADQEATDNTTLRSGEYTGVVGDRPTLQISYQRTLFSSAIGCYPDMRPNNYSTRPSGIYDDIAEALGCAIMISSQNRDAAGFVNPDRLDRTELQLDYVGMPGRWPGNEADGPEAGRVHGCRFQAGWYDLVDHLQLNQPPLYGMFGWNVSSMPDINNDQTPQIIVSAPTNEKDHQEIFDTFGTASTHWWSRDIRGSIVVYNGGGYWFNDGARHISGPDGASSVPTPTDENICDTPGDCSADPRVSRCGFKPRPIDEFEVYAEDPEDFLCDGGPAGDVNLDGVPDLLCGARLNDRGSRTDTGATYILYGRTLIGNYDLSFADDPTQRAPMIRIRGETDHDQIGWDQESVMDINGDRIDDIILGSPYADYGGVQPGGVCGDYDGDGQLTDDDLDMGTFNSCANTSEVFMGDPCKAYDFNNDRVVDELDQIVFECLEDDGGNECCPSDNGFVGIVFGGITLDGDRTIGQIASTDLPGVVFYGANAGDLAGWDVESAGDFNRDGFGDVLITAPGKRFQDENGRDRMGVVWLIFGGTHLSNKAFSLDQVGTQDLPGILLQSPFVTDRPNEATTQYVGGIGDINNDGFDDIAIGIPKADFVDETLPQDPNDPGVDPNIGRRPDDGTIYIVYGNNVGGNR